jgi:dTDP-4-dehydrorhamnose 3,5-epimerase
MRWDDPALSIQWPAPVEVMSKKDQAWPLLERQGG